MRIARVVTLASRTGRYGGPYDTAVEQVRAMLECNVPAKLIAGTLRADAPSDIGIDVSFRPVRPFLPRMRFSALMSVQMFCALFREIRTSSLVHVSFCREAIPIAAALISLAMRRQLVLQPHGMLVASGGTFRRMFDQIFIRPCLRRADIVLALTDQERQGLVRDYLPNSSSIQLLGNPIRAEFLRPLPDAEIGPASDALFIARLHRRKNPRLFAEAAREASQAGFSTRYRIVGPDDGEREAIRDVASTCDSLVLEDGISPSNIPSYLAGCRVFVVCSSNEPWGNLLIGAMAIGKPVVVTQSCALAHEVKYAAAGIVIPDDSQHGLCEAVERLIGDEQLYATVSSNAVQLANRIADPKTLHRELRDKVYAGNRSTRRRFKN